MPIKVKIIADSLSPDNVRLTTFELEYPRFIHAEIMTHRLFSRNAQSSRAVPVATGLEQAIISPVVWGKNKAGMSSSEELSQEAQNEVAYYWHALARYCQDFAERMSKAGLHKQWANRCLEWFSPIKVVVTATEWDNFFWLRIDPDAAQPEIVELATKMKEAMAASNPVSLKSGQWHLPYIDIAENDMGETTYFTRSEEAGSSVTGYFQLSLEDAKKISASACAQVSYRKLDTTRDKALSIFARLFEGAKPHLSPVEHQATPIADEDEDPWFNLPGYSHNWEKGITHATRDGQLWSGNLRGWVQYRQVIDTKEIND